MLKASGKEAFGDDLNASVSADAAVVSRGHTNRVTDTFAQQACHPACRSPRCNASRLQDQNPERGVAVPKPRLVEQPQRNNRCLARTGLSRQHSHSGPGKGSAKLIDDILDWQASGGDRHPAILAGIQVLPYRRQMAGLADCLNVVEIADVRGALAGRLLADMGADVVKVELDTLEASPAQPSALTFRNANKSAHYLDSARADAGISELLSHADVLVENVGPALRRRLGLDPIEVAERWPHLVHATITDFGLSGPRARWHAEPLVAAAASGAQWATGLPEMAPCGPPGYLAHDCASAMAVSGIIAALVYGPGGRGEHLEISVQEAALAGLVPWSTLLADYTHVNPNLVPAGPRNGDGAYLVLPAKDGHVRVVLGNPRHFEALLDMCRRPEALEEAEWRNPFFRNANRDVLKILIGDVLTDRTRSELVTEADQRGATLGAVQTPREYLNHPQVQHRRAFQTVEDTVLAAPPVVVDREREIISPKSRLNQSPWATPSPWQEAPTLGATRTSGEPLLSGFRVVKFGVAAVVPEMVYMLSELGADVVKVESSAHPDILRRSGVDDLDRSFAYNTECRGRRSVTLNITTEPGQALARELCQNADVVAENHRGTALDRFGLDYDSVRDTNPSVIYVSSQGYGQGGPLGAMPAFGPLNSAFAGIHHLWNHPNAPFPCGTGLNHPDHIAGKLASAWVVAALNRRAQTGQGAHIEMAQTEVAAYLAGHIYTELAESGVDPGPVGNTSTQAAPHNVYPAAGDDAWVAVVCADDHSFVALADVVGFDASLWPTLHDRLTSAAQIDDSLSNWTSHRSASEACEVLQAAGVSASPVMGPLDHRSCDHLKSRNYLVDLVHPAGGPERHTGNAIRPSTMPLVTAGPAPCLGQHTREILQEIGLSPDAITELIAKGVAI